MKILAFDPGTRFMGWALLEVHPPKEEVKVLRFGTFIGSKYVKSFPKEIRQKFKENFLILHAYRTAVETLVRECSPDIIASEGAFAHIHIAAAFSLVTCIHVLRTVSYKLLKKDLIIVAPKLTKKTLTGDHQAKKEAIKEAIDNSKSIILPEDTSTFTEHVYDAIGHGYHYIQTLLHPDKYYLHKAKDKLKNKRHKLA